MSLYVARRRLLSQWIGRLTSAAWCRQGQAVRVRGMATAVGLGSKPWLTATPQVCLHDVPTHLKAGGLLPHTPVTLFASLIDESGREFASHAHYITDEQGCVNVSTAAAVGGSYKGVFPAGLLTTLAPAPHEFSLLRLYRRDPSSPWKITVRLIDGHQPLETKTKSLMEVELERHLMAPGVRRLPVRDGKVRGTLYLPPGSGPFPGIIDLFGSIGGLMEFRSAMLASRGIASLALAYFAYEDLPKTTACIELDYFEEAVEVLLRQAGVVPDRCGVVAVSKAGDIACCMATYLTQVKALVTISSPSFATDSVITHRGHCLVEGHIKLGVDNMAADEGGRLHPKREILAECHPDHPKFIPIDQADDDTYFLMAAGLDDAWSMDIFVDASRKRMDSRGRGAWLETMKYPGAGHLLEPPYGAHVHHSYHKYLPALSEEGHINMVGVPALWGGNSEDHCRAQEDLWHRMIPFFFRHVRDSSPWYKRHCARDS